MLDSQIAKTRRRFTQAARDAALAKRREIAALPKQAAGSLQVFVVRRSDHANAFGWEIRQFGAIAIDRSEGVFPDGNQARVAGERALQRRCKN